jgi:predicted O-methyltransferase YrrM
MLDLGCGFGYSSLLYAKLATLVRAKPFKLVGTDYHQQFVDKAVENSNKYGMSQVTFTKHDILTDSQELLGETEGFDVCTIGFELSLDVLRAKERLFKKDALIIVPLSESVSRS